LQGFAVQEREERWVRETRRTEGIQVAQRTKRIRRETIVPAECFSRGRFFEGGGWQRGAKAQIHERGRGELQDLSG